MRRASALSGNPPASLRLAGSHAAPAAGVMPGALVLGAITFNLLLCFINTNVLGVHEIYVIASEAAILGLTLLAAYHAIEHKHVIFLGCVVLWPLLLASIRLTTGTDRTLDIKIVRDLLIPVAFYLLGTATRDLKAADRIVGWSVVIVLFFAVFEYFWTDTFVRFFNIARYYIARGTLEAKAVLQSSDLFISGIRPAGAQGGRNLLPFLGDHRVSSVFLEPVSLGNFGVIAFMWGLVRSKFDRKLHLGVMAAAIALIVFADSRFGAYLCLAAVFIALLPIAWSTFGALALPVVAIAVLSVVPLLVTGSYDPQNRYIDNGFVGRFVLSARILGDFDTRTWLALAAPGQQAFDSGYAYIISKIGILGFLALWLMPFTIKSLSPQFFLFRNLLAFYLGTILCVSNSPFTIKTASLAWFLFGTAAAAATFASANEYRMTLRRHAGRKRSPRSPPQQETGYARVQFGRARPYGPRI